MSDKPIIFPRVARVVYANNPLHEVVCQIRYPAILRITNEVPAAFQEIIRDKFPEYSEQLNSLAPVGLPDQFVQMLAGSSMAKRHNFRTRDGTISVLLDGQNLTFTTGAYSDWVEFSALVYETIKAFISEYRPSFVSRIGLRYENHINLPDNLSWEDCIRPELLGILIEDAWRENTFEYATALRCRLEHEGDNLLLQSGFFLDEKADRTFKLDFDYYVERETEPSDAIAIIERLHDYSGPAFQWAIEPGLHNVLGPVGG